MKQQIAVAVAMALSACSQAAVEAPQADHGVLTEDAAFAAALDANNRQAYAAFIERHPESVYTDLALDLMTEAGMRNDQAARNSVEAARAALATIVEPAQVEATPITASATIQAPSIDRAARDPAFQGE